MVTGQPSGTTHTPGLTPCHRHAAYGNETLWVVVSEINGRLLVY